MATVSTFGSHRPACRRIIRNLFEQLKKELKVFLPDQISFNVK